jgi:long-chain acyl-CoA synthetase
MINLLSGLRRVARLWPGQPAILGPGPALTYEQFYDRVLRGAQALASLGVAPGDRVAVLMANCPQYLELYYATAALGAVIVPMNTRWGPQEMAFTLDDSGSKLLIFDDHLAPAAAGLQVGLRLHVSEYEQRAAAALPWQGPEPEAEDLAGLFYTSGTTGGPKGAMLTHRNILANAFTSVIEFGATRDWIWLHAAPMFHLANGAAMYGLVLLGAPHCFIPGFEPEAFLDAVQRYRATSVVLVPTMLNLVLNHPAFGRYDTSSLSVLLYGASPMPLDLLRRAMDHFRCRFIQGYGMTETSPLLTVLRHEDHAGGALGSAGRPVIGVEVRVVDQHDRDVPTGEAGEIIARGANVMKGYWNRPDVSAEVLRGGWMHTGDLGAFDERGFLYILDRMKDMIKTGGENVYSPEVESVLYAHPDLLEAAVIGLPDPKWGETVHAVVVPRPGRQPSTEDIIAWCRGRLTHFKCPTSVEFRHSLPKSATGKVQKNVLRQARGPAFPAAAGP